MNESKFYLLYTDKQQTKLLTTASSKEILESESEYYDSGVWFEYDTTESNRITNEKTVKGVLFPKEPKQREYKKEEAVVPKIAGFKWLS